MGSQPAEADEAAGRLGEDGGVRQQPGRRSGCGAGQPRQHHANTEAVNEPSAAPPRARTGNATEGPAAVPMSGARVRAVPANTSAETVGTADPCQRVGAGVLRLPSTAMAAKGADVSAAVRAGRVGRLPLPARAAAPARRSPRWSATRVTRRPRPRAARPRLACDMSATGTVTRNTERQPRPKRSAPMRSPPISCRAQYDRQYEPPAATGRELSR